MLIGSTRLTRKSGYVCTHVPRGLRVCGGKREKKARFFDLIRQICGFAYVLVGRKVRDKTCQAAGCQRERRLSRKSGALEKNKGTRSLAEPILAAVNLANHSRQGAVLCVWLLSTEERRVVR